MNFFVHIGRNFRSDSKSLNFINVGAVRSKLSSGIAEW